MLMYWMIHDDTRCIRNIFWIENFVRYTDDCTFRIIAVRQPQRNIYIFNYLTDLKHTLLTNACKCYMSHYNNVTIGGDGNVTARVCLFPLLFLRNEKKKSNRRWKKMNLLFVCRLCNNIFQAYFQFAYVCVKNCNKYFVKPQGRIRFNQ